MKLMGSAITKLTKIPENILNISKMVISKIEKGSLKNLRELDQNFAAIKAVKCDFSPSLFLSYLGALQVLCRVLLGAWIRHPRPQ